MTISKIILPVMFSFFVNSFAFAQELPKAELKEDDQKNNVLSFYEYEASDHYMIIRLWLYKDSNFYFTLSSFNRDVFSEGKWHQKDDTLTLNSSLEQDNIPVNLSYTDSTNRKNNFKIGEIRNLKGKEMVDGLVAVNDRSNTCIPSYRICNNQLNSIDSIKIVFESGPSSKWLKISRQNYSQIIPVVQVNFMISNYQFFDNRKFRVLKSSVIPIQ